MNAAVQTLGLTKRFGEFKAVDKLDLEVKGGELFGLLGPNGAGKTTTVRMLCTLIEQTNGMARVAGYDITKQPSEVRKRIGVVSDGVMLYKDLSIEENLRLLGTLYHMPHSETQARIRELLGFLGLEDKGKRLVGALSTGMTKKVMIAAALLHSPEILFLDEVTSGLDPQSAIALRQFTKTLCKQGVTVIWTTHYMEEPEKICDRVAIMSGGRLVQVGTPLELRKTVSELSIVEVDAPDLSRVQLEMVRRLGDGVTVAYENPILWVTGPRDGPLLKDVMRTLLSTNARIRSFNTKSPSLEEAFVGLTGSEEQLERILENSS